MYSSYQYQKYSHVFDKFRLKCTKKSRKKIYDFRLENFEPSFSGFRNYKARLVKNMVAYEVAYRKPRLYIFKARSLLYTAVAFCPAVRRSSVTF